MDKLREAILKMANSEPNVPLSQTKNVILQQHLNRFFDCLHIAPDHPPYSWMIEKALQELNEKGGSTEDSISTFIKKEHDSLPWAHMTMLKHHLQKMTEKGEIIMIDGGRFVLPGDNKTLNRKRRRKRKYLKRKRRGNSEIKQKKPLHREKEEEKQVQHDDVEVKEQKDLAEQQNEDAQLSGQQNYVAGNRVFHRRVQCNRVNKQKEKEQLESQSEHLQDPELQQSKYSLTRVEETANISNLYPPEILENEQPGDNLPQILSPEAPPGFEFLVVEDATVNKAHASSSVELDLPKEDPVVHQSSERPGEEESVAGDLLKTQSSERPGEEESVAEDLLKTTSSERPGEEKSVAEDLLKTKKQQKKHHGWQQNIRPMRTLTRAQKKAAVTPNAAFQCQQQEQPISGRYRRQVQLAIESSSEAKQPSIEKSSETDRAQRQLKRWSKTPDEPKSVSTSKVEQLLLCDSMNQHLVHMGEPLSTSRPLHTSTELQLVQIEEPLALEIREDVLNLIDPQHEVHLKQPKNQRCRRLPKYKEDGAKIDAGTISALATKEEVLCLEDHQDEVHLKQPKDRHCGRALKGKEAGADPDTILLKDLGSSKKLTKKQNDRGLGRRRNTH
ncbi:hypothetical protein T459_11621 [Capsicum annuum]|uniref:H15 domain-containing protein n=1 Tax=Capsicum annuum TaxID=4072 RepID=A0A2G2ZMF7_CAPAN|nr:hypothetical protein T459_11621 [Capsicum annuum]